MKRIRNCILTAAYALYAATAVAQSGNPELKYEYNAGKKAVNPIITNPNPDPPLVFTDPDPQSDFQCDFQKGRGGYVVTYYKGSSDKVEIPSTYDNKIDGGTDGEADVVGINSDIFKSKEKREKITSLSLPSTLKEIAGSAFANMMQLKEIDIPENVKTIGENTFEGCTALTKVSFKSKLITVMPGGMFKGCIALVHVRFIPEWMSAAFMNCVSLKSVYIPCKVTKIPGHSFSGCENLTDVYCSSDNISLEGGNNFDGNTKSFRTLHLTSANSNIYADGTFKGKWGEYFNSYTGFEDFCANKEQDFTDDECHVCRPAEVIPPVSSKGLGYIPDEVAVNSSTTMPDEIDAAGQRAEVRHIAEHLGSVPTKAPTAYITEFVPDKAGRWLITATEINGKFKIYKYITVK